MTVIRLTLNCVAYKHTVIFLKLRPRSALHMQSGQVELHWFKYTSYNQPHLNTEVKRETPSTHIVLDKSIWKIHDKFYKSCPIRLVQKTEKRMKCQTFK